MVDSIRLKSGKQDSKLVFKADGTFKFRVDLAGPQTVVLHLPNAHLATDLPSVNNDRLLKEIKSEVKPDAIVIFIKTRAPGVTVLPSYEAVSHKLTLEFGGQPDFEVRLEPAETQTEAALPSAKPAPDARPTPPKKADSREIAPKAKPEADAPLAPPAPQPKPEPPAKQADSAPETAAQISPGKTVIAAIPPEPKAEIPAGPSKTAAPPILPPPKPKAPAAEAGPETPAGPGKAPQAPMHVAKGIIPPPPEPEPAAPPPVQTPITETAPQAKAQPEEPGPSPAAEPAPPQAAGSAREPEVPLDPPPLVLGIRRGTHAEYTRIVLDSEGPLSTHLAQDGRKLVLSLERGRLKEGAAIADPDGRISGIKVIQKDPLRLEIGLKGYLDKHKLFTLQQGKKVVLDIEVTDKPPQKTQAKPNQAPEQAPAPDMEMPESPAVQPQADMKIQPAGAGSSGPASPPVQAPDTGSAEKPPAQTAPEQPAAPAVQHPATALTPPEAAPAGGQPAQIAPARRIALPMPKPPRDQAAGAPLPAAGAIVISQPAKAPRTEPPAAKTHQTMSTAKTAPEPAAARAPAMPQKALPKLSDIIRRPAAEIPQAKTARVNPRYPAFAQGGIPPMPPPPPTARPRGPMFKKFAQSVKPPPQASVIIGPGSSNGTVLRPSTSQVIQKVVKAESQEQKEKARKPGPVVRPPQAALLGAAGKEDAEGTRAFERAKAEFDSRLYKQAYEAFELFLKSYPKHRLVSEAQFRLADAYFNMHERKFLPFYPEAMQHYQKAIDNHSKSDQVPWALLMMGRAAMLGGEPYKAAGYFEVVVEDYPDSEYVPLALVQRAQAFLNDGKVTRALEEFRKVAQRFPGSRYRKDADWGQAQALFSMARFQRASLLLKDMDRRDPELRIKEPELLYYIGEADFQQKRYAEARAYFLWALNIMPNLPDADIVLTRVGDTYKFENDHLAAKDIYRRVVNLFPDTDGALVARLRLAESPVKSEHPYEIFEVKATTDAYKTYRDIANTHPQREVGQLARLKLGVYHYKRKEYQQSLEMLSGLLHDNPGTVFKPQISYTVNLVVLGILERLQAENKPLQLMNTYMEHQSSLTRPNGDRVLKMLAWAYEQSGWYKEADNLYTKLISRGVVDSPIKLKLARVRLKNFKYKGIPGLLGKDVTQDLKGGDLVEAHSILGRALLKTGDPASAVEKLKLAVSQRSEGTEAAKDFYAMGLALDKLNKPLQALDSLERASKILEADSSPTGKALHYLVAMDAGGVAVKARRVDKSAEFYQTAEKAASSTQAKGQALYCLAQSKQEANDLKGAVGVWRKLAQLRVEPWSGMAVRHLEDMKLAPSLVRVGK